jgi:hypothetical protein
MLDEKIKALCKIAKELPDQFVEAWRQSFVRKGYANPKIGTSPDEVLLQIIRNRIFLRHGKLVTENLFAKFGPQPKQAEARLRRHVMAALYGDHGKPPIKQFAREAAEHNRKTIKRLSMERAEAAARGRAFLEEQSPRELLGGGATRAESMLQYVRRMLKDKECREIIEDSYANGLFGERGSQRQGVYSKK